MAVIQPFGERILVKVLEPSTVSESGLLVVPTSKEMSNEGEVVAVGEGSTLPNGELKPLRIKVGDKVLFTLGAGIDYSYNKEDYKILNVRDVLGKITEGK